MTVPAESRRKLGVAMADHGAAEALCDAILSVAGDVTGDNSWTGANDFAGALTVSAAGLVGFYGVTPTARRSAYTQTYATADKTHANATTTGPSTTLVLTATAIAAKTASLTLTDADVTSLATLTGSVNQAQKDIGTAFNTLRVEVAAAVADLADLKQLVNAVIDDLQADGLAQ